MVFPMKVITSIPFLQVIKYMYFPITWYSFLNSIPTEKGNSLQLITKSYKFQVPYPWLEHTIRTCSRSLEKIYLVH